MSSYRPKSLDELNSRYDQAMSADMAIKKGVSGIKESEIQQKETGLAADTNDFNIEAEGLTRRISSPKNIEDISGAVDDFIRHLNNEYGSETFSGRPQPQSIPQPQPMSPRKPIPVAEPEPMNDERSELLDNYMKVMTDQYEDDDDLPSEGYLKKKGRKRRREKPILIAQKQEPIIPDRSEPMPLPEVDYSNVGHMMNDPAPAQSEPQSDENGTEELYENLNSAFDQLDEQATVKTKPKKGKGRVVLRALFSLLLVVVIAATAAVASLVLVFKVNTGSVVFEKYCFVTTSASFEEANLKSGDLVICEASDTVEDGRFVLCVDKEAGSFFFGKKNGEMVDAEGNKMSLVDGRQIYKDNILGRVKRSLGHVGTIIDLIFRYYIPVLGALLILAIVLILIVAVALRNKNKGIVDDDDDNPVEAEDEEDNSPVPQSEETDEPQPETEYEPSDEGNDDPDEKSEPKRKSGKKKRRKDKKKKKSFEPEDTPESDETEEDESESFDENFDSYSDI